MYCTFKHFPNSKNRTGSTIQTLDNTKETLLKYRTIVKRMLLQGNDIVRDEQKAAKTRMIDSWKKSRIEAREAFTAPFLLSTHLLALDTSDHQTSYLVSNKNCAIVDRLLPLFFFYQFPIIAQKRNSSSSSEDLTLVSRKRGKNYTHVTDIAIMSRNCG